jgi:hypothetical protein
MANVHGGNFTIEMLKVNLILDGIEGGVYMCGGRSNGDVTVSTCPL